MHPLVNRGNNFINLKTYFQRVPIGQASSIKHTTNPKYTNGHTQHVTTRHHVLKHKGSHGSQVSWCLLSFKIDLNFHKVIRDDNFKSFCVLLQVTGAENLKAFLPTAVLTFGTCIKMKAQTIMADGSTQKWAEICRKMSKNAIRNKKNTELRGKVMARLVSPQNINNHSLHICTMYVLFMCCFHLMCNFFCIISILYCSNPHHLHPCYQISVYVSMLKILWTEL